MTFTFNTGVPAAANDPSVDQPDMLSNNVSTNSILAVDHISFNTAGGGQHLQMHMNATPTYIAVPAVPVGNDSVIYTNAGIASSAAQLFLRNSNVILPLSIIRAWATFAGPGALGVIALPAQSRNVVSITKTAVGRFSVVLTANAVTGATFGVLVSCGLSPVQVTIANYTITGVGTFDLIFVDVNKVNADPTLITFQVLQI